MTATMRVLGAAGTVTGSRYLVETDDGARVLVDCGLFQGYKKLRERNWSEPPFAPSSVDAVVLTHAHIDHSGYLPRLCKLGFSGPVHCTRGTRDLLQILLPDAGHLQEEDARHANRHGYARHRPAEPLYTYADARRSLGRLSASTYDETVEVARGISATFRRAGHIVGSACVELRVEGTTLTFTGDVGRSVDPIMKPAAPLGPAHVLVTESTYGDRRHPKEDVRGVLERIVMEAVDRKGVILVPAFAVGRAQHLLHVVADLKAAGRIPDIPAYLDSPMAINATRIFCRHKEDHLISDAQCHRMCEAASYTRTPDESRKIDRRSGPMLVVSASGMATGGRILHHLARFLPDERNTVLVVGFQASGTRGRDLVEGAEEIKIHGSYVPVRANVVQVHGLSAHADYGELLDWLAAGTLSPRQALVTHGEPAAADALRRRLEETFGWNVSVPDVGATLELA